MNNFVFQNHTRIYFGKGVVGQYLAKLLQPYGTNVLLAYGGGSIKKTGVYEAVVAQLRAAGKTVFDFPGINNSKAQLLLSVVVPSPFFTMLTSSSFIQ